MRKKKIFSHCSSFFAKEVLYKSMELCLIVPFFIVQFAVACRAFAKKKDGILELISCSIHSYWGNFVYFVILQGLMDPIIS